MRITIIGAGSIGLLLAGKLNANGCASIRLVTRTEEQAETIRLKGITVREAATGRSLHTEVSVCSIHRLAECEEADWAFLTVKQQAIDRTLLRLLRESAPPASGLVCWQNGIGHLDLLAEEGIVSPGKLFAAVTTEGALRQSPAVVAHTGAGMTAIGRAVAAQAPEETAEPAEKKLADRMKSAGFATVASKNIGIEVWNKLLINAAINPLTAILNVANGGLLQAESARRLMRRLAEEAAKVAQAEGISPPDDLIKRIEEVCRRTAPNRSSMLQDLDRRSRTENEWISGSLVRLAAKHHLQIPATETVYQLVQALEKRG
jgi:2-dehydropantoate 2-reductase